MPTIFAVNRSIRIFLEIGSRSFLTSSWARRAYNCPSGPVRYVPGNYNQNKKTQKCPQLRNSEKREAVLPDNKVSSKGERVSHKFSNSGSGVGSLFEMSSPEPILEPECVESADVFSHLGEFSEFEDATDPNLYHMDSYLMEESELLIDESRNLCEDKISERNQPDSSKTKQDAENMAIESLATRTFTAVELHKKLHGKKYPLNIIESVIVDLQRRGLLNDGLYAESFSQSRWLSLCWGPRRIKRALVQKGVSEADADKATKQVFAGGDTSGRGQDTYLGMSKLSMDRLFAQASKQWLRAQNTSFENRKSRMVRWLQYRGFDWGVTNFILKKLMSEYSP